MKKKKKVLITGAGGYVGSTLADILKDEYDVLGFGHETEVGGDITDYKALLRVICGSFAVIHTASPTNGAYCKENPYEALRAIVYGTRNVRRAVEENKVPLLIHFSTQAVYSNFAKRPLPLRETLELKPDTLYGALKAAAEDELSGGNAIILRPANIYGVGAEVLRSNVVSVFAKRSKKGESLEISGTGKQKVDFVHVRDVARLVEIMLKKRMSKNSLPIIVNVGSGKPTSIKEIARLVSVEIKKKKERKHQKLLTKKFKKKHSHNFWVDMAYYSRGASYDAH